jgi:TPR repeat protein
VLPGCARAAVAVATALLRFWATWRVPVGLRPSRSQPSRDAVDGRSVARDHARAVSLWEQACTLGESGSWRQLGIALRRGRGVSVDVDRAGAIFQDLCDREGDTMQAESCYDVGLMLANGEIGDADPAAAQAWFQRACALEYVPCARLQPEDRP